MVTVTEHCDKHHHHLGYISWTAIIVGTLVALGLGFLFSLFNLGIGLYAFTLDPQTMGNIAIVGYIWLIISSIITLFIAGWVAGRIASATCLKRRFGVLYGFTTWSLALIVTLIIASHFPSNVHVGTSPTSTQEMIQAVNLPGQHNALINVEKVTNTAGKVTLATFILFLLGAIASCIGGSVGMKRRPEDTPFIHPETKLPTPPPSDKPLSGDAP